MTLLGVAGFARSSVRYERPEYELLPSGENAKKDEAIEEVICEWNDWLETSNPRREICGAILEHIVH